MELVLTRRKKQGMMGGVSFEVHAKIKLGNSEGSALAEGGFAAIKMFDTPEIGEDITVGGLVEGKAFKSKNVLAAMTFAIRAIKAAKEIQQYLLTAAAFVDGERIYTSADFSSEPD